MWLTKHVEKRIYFKITIHYILRIIYNYIYLQLKCKGGKQFYIVLLHLEIWSTGVIQISLRSQSMTIPAKVTVDRANRETYQLGQQAVTIVQFTVNVRWEAVILVRPQALEVLCCNA